MIPAENTSVVVVRVDMSLKSMDRNGRIADTRFCLTETTFLSGGNVVTRLCWSRAREPIRVRPQTGLLRERDVFTRRNQFVDVDVSEKKRTGVFTKRATIVVVVLTAPTDSVIRKCTANEYGGQLIVVNEILTAGVIGCFLVRPIEDLHLT